MQLTAVVTGGAGFIGSHLVELLIKENFKVLVLDNLSTGRLSNLDSLKGDSKPTFLRVDVDQMEALNFSSFYSGRVDYLFHLAGLADIVPSLERPLDYYHSNVTGTLRMLELARVLGVKKFIYAASSSCYGIPDVYPTPETAPIKPQYPYALTKYLGEEIVLAWGKIYKMSTISLRLFNVYGPKSRTTGAYGAVFGVFLAQKLANKPLTIVGDGKQTRDFTYVSDVADAFLCAAKSSVENEVFNVGSGNTYPIESLVKLIGGPTTHIPKRPGEPNCTHADISRIKERLNWKPRVSFEDGVRKVVNHISDWKDAPVWTPESIAKATKTWFQYLETSKC